MFLLSDIPAVRQTLDSKKTACQVGTYPFSVFNSVVDPGCLSLHAGTNS